MPTLATGAKAIDFSLPGVDGKTYSLDTFRDKSVLVVMFTCNHCPYVQAYEDRLIAIQRDYLPRGVAMVAINPNETKNHPEDSFDEMVKRAQAQGYTFPYLRDESQDVARAYGATRTPEIFLFDAGRLLRYRGTVDDNWERPDRVKTPYLRVGLDAVLADKPVPHPETMAVGCTIKWA